MAFLIQKNDGRFTIRRWGAEYDTHIIPSWQITQSPRRNYNSAQQNYFSSCVVKYLTGNVIFNGNEIDALEKYSNKNIRKTFETDLFSIYDAQALAEDLSNRFTLMKEEYSVSVGYDTSAINLLDTVELEIKINDRTMSANTMWIVKEVDPAQDTLVLEEKPEA
jgi:hypothetical protein